MQLGFMFKYRFFNAFRELFVHHHGSLEFRAKIFALIITANEESHDDAFTIVKKIALDIYNHDEDRANLLMLSTKELVQKIKDDNAFNIDTLIANIQKELKIIPRYAKKIDTQSLKELVDLSRDRDTLAYQENILEFLQLLKEETLYANKSQIAKDEEVLGIKH